MDSALSRFQDGFAQALLAPDADAGLTPEIAALARQPAFAVYRNTVMKGCIDALQANYPAVARLVGEAWFRAAAAIFARERLPAQATLLNYGEAFAEFLAGFEPAADLPYLPGVARLDRCWTESHAAADEPVLAAATLAALAPEALASTVLHPHAAARWAWFDDQPIYTIWQRNRAASQDESEIEWQGEGALLARPRGAVLWAPLDAAGCAFLDACAAGLPLAAASAAALEARDDADLARLMKTLLENGAFARMSSTNKT
ncbi:MAG: putative DNA-binding domain-containing protein [Burkholderiales bacterium]|nr:putative DNA-binding domain-containing protein [Burkholderiales bacterium]